MNGYGLLSAAAQGAVAVANNCNLPINYNTDTNWVHNCWTTHKSGPAGYSVIDLYFVNFLTSANSEQAGYYDFNLRVGIYLNGTFYQANFAGQSTALVSKNYGVARGRVYTYIPPNTTFVVTNRRVAADNGVAGSYNVLTNAGGILARQDGILNGTDPTQDYTLGVGVAYGAQCLQPPTINNGTGAVTAVAMNTSSEGVGYTSGANLGFWYGPAGVGQPGATALGTAAPTGYGNLTGGSVTSITITGGGTGHNSSSPPQAFLGGGGGFGVATTASYGPSLIVGQPRLFTPSVLLHGDSITAGYGSVDSTGDLHGNYGCLEQALANCYGVHKLAVGGESAAGWLTNNANQLAFIATAIRNGLRPTHVILALGVNDFLTNTNSNVLTAVQGYISQIAAIWRNYGAKVLMTTIPPCNTTNAGSNKFTTVAEQTPYNSNYTLGSYVDQYNAALLNKTGPANDGVIDIRSLCQDATTTTAWRVDCYGGTTAFCATDGIHPSIGVGIPYLTANMTIPTLL